MNIGAAARALATSVLLAGCPATEPASQVKVFKYDGSVQCENPGTSVEDMQRELTDAGIPDQDCGT